ncbi:hypothetical protein F1B92_00155 [Campylobacter sp. FMV-PI01]|uniref:Tetratricopeptide repeat protein n=1 Tax=Campylobacter portucalensis TaxID=2608384 RepID=A0A6L5WFC0_9BACT|nr:hypothetical protein [Campylobacter portucalensis]MSN95624.1 hypothetical protein [Campylobacter portucalensis]
MALKDDLKGVKESIDSNEALLENIIKSELFVKKYKKPLIVLSVLIVIVVLGYFTNNYIEHSNFKSANLLYSELIENPNNQKAKDDLKNKSINLYALYEFRLALDKNDTQKIKELSQMKNIDKNLINIMKFYINEDSSDIMKSYRAFLNGYKLLKDGKIDQANNEFLKIPSNSELFEIVKNLKHYNGIKNEKN